MTARPHAVADADAPASLSQSVAVEVGPAYRPDQRPDVEILIEGQWRKGELRQWSVDGDDNWSGQVNWRREVGHTYIDTFPAGRIRPDENEDLAR